MPEPPAGRRHPSPPPNPPQSGRERVWVYLRLGLGLGGIMLVLGALGIVAEALSRARLTSAADRMPSALYTRPVPWGQGNDRTGPMVIGGLGSAPLEERLPVELADLPDHLVQAVLAVEDQRFYDHNGLDLRRVAGALLANLRAGTITQGGSTLTQQLAKNLFLTANRTPLRKIRELAIAFVLEARYDKPTILQAYLNEIYLGQDGARAIHGVGAAARYYFGKGAERVSLAESALLAGMIRAPNRYAPTRNASLAQERRALVLQLMREQGRISESQADRARRASLPGRSHPALTLDARWFRDFVLRTGPASGPERGVAVYTTLDPRLQVAAERAVRNGLGRLRSRDIEAALVALDPHSGDVLAMIGGSDYSVSQFNRATEAQRQPGSAFKPVVALTALERWEGQDPAFTLASFVDDGPLRVETSAGPWRPANYDGQYRGLVTLRRAMEQSLNVPFARIGLAVGPDRIIATARRLGFTSPLHPVPSTALGSSEVSLLELTRAYGVLAAGGDLAPTRVVLGQGSRRNEFRADAVSLPARAVDPAVAYLVTSMLQGVVTRGTGYALNGQRRFPEIAGKTGTTNDWRDAWFIAYTPSLVVGAWVGYDDGRSLGMTGAGAALPIVAAFLDEIFARVPWSGFEMPEGITEGYVRTADQWTWECGTRELFLRGTEPERRVCLPFELPIWEPDSDWAEELGARAARVIERIARALERRRR